MAGGASRRMGADKALLKPWGASGPTLLAHALSLLGSVADFTVIATAPDREYPGGINIHDALPGTGPAAGLESGLSFAQANGFTDILLLACDLPHLTTAPLAWLKERHFRRAPQTLATFFFNQTSHKLETLAAFYNTALLAPLRTGMAGGERAMTRLVPKNLRNIVPLPPRWSNLLLNCNTPAELETATGSLPRTTPAACRN